MTASSEPRAAQDALEQHREQQDADRQVHERRVESSKEQLEVPFPARGHGDRKHEQQQQPGNERQLRLPWSIGGHTAVLTPFTPESPAPPCRARP